MSSLETFCFIDLESSRDMVLDLPGRLFLSSFANRPVILLSAPKCRFIHCRPCALCAPGGAPAEIQMTMIPSDMGYRIRALSASEIVGGNNECLFSEEGESRQFRDSHAKKSGGSVTFLLGQFAVTHKWSPQQVGPLPSRLLPRTSCQRRASWLFSLDPLIPKSFLSD